MAPNMGNSLLVMATLVVTMLAGVHSWTHAGAGTGRALRAPVRTPLVAPRRVSCAASVSMNSQELESMRGLAKEKRDEISRLEKMLRDERDSLRNAEERITVLTGTRSPVVKETALRSLVKAVGWRITAGIVTFSTSMYFTGDVRLALSIVGSDFISKSGTMYVGERLFNKVQIGRNGKGGGDSPWRSVAKALIWRLFALVNTLVVSTFVTGKPSIGAKIAGADSIIKTSLMVVYDQAWNKIDWGRELENVGGDGI